MYKTLIVDDDIATLYMLKRFKKWQNYGFTIDGEAGDGKEALRKLEAAEYDLIITDIKMPGMNGVEFLQEMRSRSLDTCVIFLSTHSDFEYAKQGIRYGVFEYMTKPFEDGMLADILTRAKVHIDQKYEQSLKPAGKAQEEGRVYYPNNHENTLLSLILSGDGQLENAAAETFRDICTLHDGDAAKILVMANTLLFNISRKVDETFPWLNRIEGIINPPCMRERGGIETILPDFTRLLNALQAKIQKYQLNHPDGIIRKICRCVIENIESEISLEFIANEVHISRDYVGKIFKQKVLCNFNDYVTKVKMEHAKYLLAATDCKNYEISERLGYKKADYFSSLFKAYTGITPMEYRKNRNDGLEILIN